MKINKDNVSRYVALGILVGSLATGLGFSVNSGADEFPANDNVVIEETTEAYSYDLPYLPDETKEDEETIEEVAEETETEPETKVEYISYKSAYKTETTAIPLPEGSYFQDIGYNDVILARIVRKEIDNNRSDEILYDIYKNFTAKTMEGLVNYNGEELEKLASILGLPKDGKIILQDNSDGSKEIWYCIEYKEKDDIVFYDIINLMNFYFDCEKEYIKSGGRQ